ncbi:MAG: NTP transferase domain-containing protein [Anaerolineaceae bacterium]|nr:NTP transferase domain-containing protein [Anaerolineaceae bacterium]
MFKTDNAIIMAAGYSSRFAPISFEKPKGLIEVKGEILIERQIRQLREAGISRIILVTGYMKEKFEYLREKLNVILVENTEYQTRNNNSSIWAARDFLRNSYVCSSDNYFVINPFESRVDDAYYAAVYANGKTDEWCMTEDAEGYINSVTIGGENAWYMLGHTFWTASFSEKFLDILSREYDLPETKDKLWEKIFLSHLDELKMRIRHYSDQDILEFDTLDELRAFDETYKDDTRSAILKSIAGTLKIHEKEIKNIQPCKSEHGTAGFRFQVNCGLFEYDYDSRNIRNLN